MKLLAPLVKNPRKMRRAMGTGANRGNRECFTRASVFSVISCSFVRIVNQRRVDCAPMDEVVENRRLVGRREGAVETGRIAFVCRLSDSSPSNSHVRKVDNDGQVKNLSHA